MIKAVHTPSLIDEARRAALGFGDRIHLVGIGGRGMSAAARWLHALGFRVSGSDLASAFEMFRRNVADLQALGIPVLIGHDPNQVDASVDLVIYSEATHDNVEVARGRDLGVRVQSRLEVVGRLMDTYGHAIAVAGAQGKTTTTAMVGSILRDTGRDPTVYNGVAYPPFGSNLLFGRGDYVVAESCEFQRQFLHLRPEVALLTNIRWEHRDTYQDLDEVLATFSQFASCLRPAGSLVLERSSPLLPMVRTTLDRNLITFGSEHDADIVISDVHAEEGATRFWVQFGGLRREVRLSVLGTHNIRNACAALAACHAVGVSLPDAADAVTAFRGVPRRMEFVGRARGVSVYDDTALHPQSLAVVFDFLDQVRTGQRRVAVFWAVSPPRVRSMFDELVEQLARADEVIVVEIALGLPHHQAAPDGRSAESHDVSGEDLAQAVRGRGTSARFAASPEEVGKYLLESVRPGTAVVTLGVDDVRAIGEELLGELR